jgi:RimJ/RimL family protein N-acetyltransferase
MTSPTIQLRRWSEADLPLLHQLLGDPVMTEHIGGAETSTQIEQRHQRYLNLTDPERDQMFAILVGVDAAPAGSIGYWEREGEGEVVYETGWSVLPAFQGQGIATKGIAALLMMLRPIAKHRYVHAYPSINNAPSNAICRKAGFTLVGEEDFEYPKGHWMRCNDWRYDLQQS